MSDDDPYKEYRIGAESTTAAEEVGTDPYSLYRSPGTASPVVTPRAPTELSAAPGDKYRAAAFADRAKMLQPGGLTGGDPSENFAGRPMRGNLFGWADEIGALVGAPAAMARHGTFNPAEGYRYAKAKEKLASEAANAAQGGWGTAAELAGGFSTGAGVMGGTRAGSNASSVLTRAPQTTIPFTNKAISTGAANWGKNVGLGFGLGAVGGAGGAEDIAGIPKGLIMGGVLGAGLGGATPAIASAIGHGARTLQMPRLRDPEKIATEQIAEVTRRAGVNPHDIPQRVADAQASGQPFTFADAVGYEAQRKLAALAKTPGEQRARIVEAVNERNQNMPYRVGGEINRTLGVRGTAEQAETALAARAGEEAGPIYRQAEQHPTWSSRLQTFLDDPIAHQGLREGVELQRLRNVGTDRPFRPTDAMITNFNEAGEPIYSGVPNVQTLQTLKMGLDRMVEANTDQFGRLNARGAAIMGFRNRMLGEMDAINPTYAQARATYADPMQVRAAVDTGRNMASRTARPEDTIPMFNQLRPAEQEGVRVGYADKLQSGLSGTGNFPPLLRAKVPKGVQELEALTVEQGPRRPGEPSMARKFFTREEEMQRTGKAATGGSPTAENIADINASPGGAEALGAAANLATGNVAGAGSNLLNWVKRVGAGESEAQRIAITRGLLEQNPDMIREMARRIAIHEERRRGVNPWVPQRPPRYPEGE